MAKAKAADKFHSDAPEPVVANLKEIIEKHHKGLSGSKILIQFKHGDWKSKGKVIFGKVQVLTDCFRRKLLSDAILYLNSDWWYRFSPAQKNYLLDHFMYQLDTVCDRHGSLKRDMDGRPKLTTVPHDFEGFAAIVGRHGVIMEDMKRLASAMQETNQLTFDEIKEEPKTEIRDGIEYKLDGSGEVIVDKDQASLALEGDKLLDPMAALMADTKEIQELSDDDLPL